MVQAAVTFYDVVLWLHVTAVVVGFGSTFAYGVILAGARRRDPRSLPGLLAGLQSNDRTLVTIGAIVVLVTGVYLAADRWDFADFFIGWGIIAVLVLLGLVHGFFLRNERRAEEAAARDVEHAAGGEVQLGEEFEAVNVRLGWMGGLAGLIVVVTVYVMVAKPFL